MSVPEAVLALAQVVDVEMNLGTIIGLVVLISIVSLVWHGNRPSVRARYRDRDAAPAPESSSPGAQTGAAGESEKTRRRGR
jgi:hypothetical protein